jgi:hypothetical protein
VSDTELGEQAKANRYTRIIERLFFDHFTVGATSVAFDRREIEPIARDLGITLPKNLGDLVYSFRYRTPLPASVVSRAPAGQEWIILPAGRGLYRFAATDIATVLPRAGLAEIRIPDATPGIIVRDALGDEQALLAKVRYNRLVDTFLGVTCYSLQSHLRTTAPEVGQIETDEVYVGVDRRGAQYVIPVQAKRGSDRLSIVQIWQDVWMCRDKFPALLCRPIAAVHKLNDAIALILFEVVDGDLKIAAERHYRLVAPDAVGDDLIRQYNASAE